MKNRKFANQLHYNLMMLPCLVLQVLFSIVPMVGIVLAFQVYNPRKGFFGSKWIGLENFRYMLQLPDITQIFVNTVALAVMKIVVRIVFALLFALLLNEARKKLFKSAVQTVVYIPHFISWVLLAAIFNDMFSLNGVVNHIVTAFGGEPIRFMTSNFWFPAILVGTEVLKEFGYSAIIFLAALTAISPELYEAADIDGCTRMKKLRYITLPGITTTIVLVLTLALGDVMNANFDQVFNMYNPLVYKSADIIDTYVYRIGLQNAQFGLATAVGLLKSVVSLLLIVVSYKLAERHAGYRIF